MEIQVSVHDWLELPMPVRIKMKQIFNVPQSKGSLVEGNVVKSDGHTYEDLKAITVEKMLAYLDSKDSGTTDFVTLFNACVDKIKEEDKELEPVEKVSVSQLLIEEWAAHLGRMILQAQNLELTDHLRLLFDKLLPYAPNTLAGKEAKQKGLTKRRSKAA